MKKEKVKSTVFILSGISPLTEINIIKSKILKTVHETAQGLHKAKAISEITMKEFDKLCLFPTHELKPKEIKRLVIRRLVEDELIK